MKKLRAVFIILNIFIGTFSAAQDSERRGPNGRFFFNISDKIQVGKEIENNPILSIANTIFPDDNPSSGYFYYYPAEYSLNWQKNSNIGRYDFNIRFGRHNEATLIAILSPKLTTADVQIAKKLLIEINRAEGVSTSEVKRLTSLPMNKSPEIVFSNLEQFGVNKDNISIRFPSSLTEPILISITTVRINDLLNMLLKNNGLYGEVVIYPDGIDMPSNIRIPFLLKINDPKTYGPLVLPHSNWPQEKWKNNTDYPVELSQLHVLRQELNGQFLVNSWSLENLEVLEREEFKFSQVESLPTSFDDSDDIQRIWMDYNVLSCRSCDQKILSDITSGSSSNTEDIKIVVIEPIKFSGAVAIILDFQSFQAKPDNHKITKMESLRITKDYTDFLIGPLFISEDETQRFEYRIRAFMPDGTVHESPQWITSQKLTLVINERLIRKHIPYFR